jgi:hypothetical protein
MVALGHWNQFPSIPRRSRGGGQRFMTFSGSLPYLGRYGRKLERMARPRHGSSHEIAYWRHVALVAIFLRPPFAMLQGNRTHG